MKPDVSTRWPFRRHWVRWALWAALVWALPLRAQEAADPALELYYSANAAYNRALYPIAITSYTDFLNRYGTHEKAPLARYGLGLSQFALKQYDKGAVEFAKLLELNPLDPKIERDRLILLHAQCLLNSGKKDDALNRLIAAEPAMKPGVHRTGALAALADLFFSKQDWSNTILWSQKVRDSQPTPAQSIRAGYQEGFAQYKSAKVPEAIAVLDKARSVAAIAEDKEWMTRIELLLSECHLATPALDKAETALQAALAGLSGREAADVQYRLATVRFAREKWAEAQADYEAFLKAIVAESKDDPRIREAQFHVARCLMERGEKGPAEGAFGRLLDVEDEVAARAFLWRGRLYSRDAGRGNRYGVAANSLAQALDKKWYQQGFPAKPGETPSTIVADIDFELASARMLQDQPKWDEALALLVRIGQKKPDYRHMPAVLSQQAICQHKLGQFPASLATTTAFLNAHATDALAGDVRFLHAENMFMLEKYAEATAAYQAFLVADATHAKRLAAEFRLAQILHHQQQFEASNKLAIPLLAKAPEGELFSQLAFVVGDNHFRSGKWVECIKPFESFLAKYMVRPTQPDRPAQLTRGPNVDTALVELAVASANIDKKPDAVLYLNTLVNGYSVDSPHLPLALAELGKLQYEAGQLDAARRALETFVQLHAEKKHVAFQKADDEVGRVNYYLGWVDAAQKRHVDAAEHFRIAAANSRGRKGVDGTPMESDAALQQGIALIDAKEYLKAAEHLQGVVNRYGDHPHKDLVAYYAGLAYARAEKWPQAAAFFQRVVEGRPDAPFADKATYEWAWCERAQGRKPQAIERYNLFLTRYAASDLATKVQSELAELNLDAGGQDAVIAKLTAAIKEAGDPKLAFDLRYQLASAHFKKQDYESAAPMFEALIAEAKDSPLLPSILFQAGESRLALTETVPAREHYLAATLVKNVPKELAESILLRLGETQNITGQHKEAEASYRRFLGGYRESPWTRNAQYGLAFALEKQENYPQAIGEYTRLLPESGDKQPKMDKWAVQARYQIGECHFNQQEYDKAMAAFISVDTNAKGYPDWQAKAVLEMGRILLAQGKQPDALARMKEVLQRFPETKAAVVAQKYLDDLRAGG